MPALRVERVVVRDGRLVCYVELDKACPRLTTPELAERVCARFPDLPRHACVNGKGDTFGAVIGHTPLPHLLEHLIVDLQTQADPASLFVGTTEWVREAAGRARIEVSFTDDLVALRALSEATRFLNESMVP